MIKLSDYVMQFAVRHGIDTVFTVSGGGIMHLVESLGTEPALSYYCNYHEQASAICAEAYARHTGKPAMVLVTVGPGAVNAISGMAGAWYDGLPMIVITGQVRRDLIADYSVVRQYGPQEGNTVGLASTLTKYAAVVMKPEDIRCELEKAWYHATSGRPGPVLLDLPLDVQGAQIDEEQLEGFRPPVEQNCEPEEAQMDTVLQWLKQARRPVLLGGSGVRGAGAQSLFIKLAETLGIPVVVPFTGKDLIAEDHPLNMGVVGTTGQRRANFTLQNADLVIGCAVGASIIKLGFNAASVAPKARKIMVDIDAGQLNHLALKPDLGIQADLRCFLQRLLQKAQNQVFSWSPRWLPACQNWKSRYPIIVDEFFADKEHVNSYVFVDTLSRQLLPSDVVVTGNGMEIAAYFQALRVQEGQRCYTSNNWGSMGWGLPMAIGASLANGKKRAICLTGDGSLQWNIQELLFLQYHRLPVVVFVFNNDGYACIRATQDAFFKGHYVAADGRSGVGNPNFKKLAEAYSLSYFSIRTNEELEKGLQAVLSEEGPVLCELNISPKQVISPKASAFRRPDGTMESRPLEDMAPFLPREEVYANMHLFDNEQ